ncbi:hydroxyglutarate oxidase [Serratia rubidaea]|uniref:Hydroxyglutarate oxidase n=1 Tax=Serratia rubidaea TaxID=61652 RepID=A0A447QRR9_SERRU|nr:hydroxyglutarate oxidase [Serratia rubidaea]
MYDVIIIGSGLVGLGVANALQEHNPRLKLLIVDKEPGRRRIRAAITATWCTPASTISPAA